MAITEADIKLLASERMTDNADGGGFMTGSVVPDNVENNVFPDVSDADRTFGRVQLRKVYCAVTSDDQDSFLGAHAIIDETPADPAVSCLMVTKAGYDQTRADLASALDSSSYKVVTGSSKRILGSAVLTATVTDAIHARFAAPTSRRVWNGTAWVDAQVPGEVVPGDILGLFSAQTTDPIPGLDAMEVAYVAAVPGGTIGAGSFHLAALSLSQPVQRSYNNNADVTYNANAADGYTSAPGVNDWAVKLQQDIADGALKFYGQTLTTGALEPGDTTLPVASTLAQYIPVGDSGVYPTVSPAVLGVDPDPYSGTFGRVQIFRADEALVIHHTAETSPATATVGTVDLGRDRLAKVQVFGDDGNEITAGFTVNLGTGHVTFTSVAGYSQPVTIKHRVEDMLLIASANEGSIVTARGVTHDFPSGSKVSSVLMFGDMQAAVHDGFPQATWTGVFSDTVIGSTPTADFFEALHPITTTNAGAITERWAVIFTNATNFRVVGEQVGEVIPASTGNTGTNCAPLNPATGEPFFTIPSTGWGTGWAAGNVFRFNTTGANAPIWLIRSIAPSDPFVGQDKFTVALRGNVNA